jgi:hypothetical protein
LSAIRDGWAFGLGAFGAANVANGLWMMFNPAGWYVGVPAAVPDFGPLNTHFVRDIGAAYFTLGAGLVWASLRPSGRVFGVGVATIFYVLHAAGHVLDTASGHVGPEHWLLDFPAIYLPTLALIAAWVALLRRGTA